MRAYIHGYSRITYYSGIYEFFFEDLRRTTVDAFLEDAQTLIPEMANMARIRVLMNFTCIAMPTPAASAAFEKVGQMQSAIQYDARTAILVRDYLVASLMQTHMRQHRGLSKTRLFTKRDEAMNWLEIEAPAKKTA